MKMAELKIKSTTELQKLLTTLTEQLRSLKFKHSQRELKDASQIKKTKKDIARILTLLNFKNNKLNSQQ